MPLSSLSAMYFVYGLYTALFISYIRILRCRNVGTRERSQAKTLYLLPTIILFILTTLVVIGQTIFRGLVSYFTYIAVQTKHVKPLIHFLQHDPRKSMGIALSVICPALLNATADYILIHRCHTIYGSRKWITLPLVVVSIGTNVLGMVGASMYATGDRVSAKDASLSDMGNFLSGVFFVMSVVVNILITTLTAGRICIESGLIYPVFTLLHFIMIRTITVRDVPFEFSSISNQTAGIAPTLIVVRAQLGKTVETMHDQVVSDIKFGSRPPPPDCSSGVDGGTQAADEVFNMLQAHASGSGNLDWKKGSTSVANQEHASHCSAISLAEQAV
ncbi:hypothetical protein MPER_12508 [Moniliophthora perniciosa FA553]|nr:hypothetical protein MPER_12508 [Moniliophthora perniciosa FA553]